MKGCAPRLPHTGYEIVPVNSIAGWLFLVFAVLLLHSIYFKWENIGDVLSGTMAVFSLYLLVRCVCVAVLAALGAWGGWLLFGGRVLTLLPVFIAVLYAVLWRAPAVGADGRDCGLDCVVGYCGFADGGAYCVVSFQAERFLSHSGLLLRSWCWRSFCLTASCCFSIGAGCRSKSESI